jgi:hypothetical protein
LKLGELGFERLPVRTHPSVAYNILTPNALFLIFARGVFVGTGIHGGTRSVVIQTFLL